MTFYDKCTVLSKVIKDEYRTHKEQLNNQVKYSLNIKQNNKVCWDLLWWQWLIRKQVKEFVVSIGKIRIVVHLSHSFVFLLAWQCCVLWLILMPV